MKTYFLRRQYPFILFVLCLSAWRISWAQAPSLRDTVAARPLLQKGDSLFTVASYDQALQYYDKAAQVYARNNVSLLLADVTIKKALAALRLGKYSASDSLLGKASLFITTENPTKAHLYAAKGEWFLNMGQPEEALLSFQKAQALYQKAGKKYTKELARSYGNIGLVYWSTNNLDLALEHLYKCLDLSKEAYGLKHPQLAAAYNDIGLVYTQKDPKVALDFYQKALEIYQATYPALHPSIAVAYNNIATVQKQQQKGEEALPTFEKALAIWQKLYKIQRHPNEAFVLSSIGQIYAEKNNDQEALKNFFAAAAIYRNYYGEKHPELAQTLHQIGNIYLHQGKAKLALETFQEALCANLIDYHDRSVYSFPPLKNYYNPELLLVSLSLKSKAFEELYNTKTLKKKDLEQALYATELADSLVDIIRRSRTSKADKIRFSAQVTELYENAIHLCLLLAEVSISKKEYGQKAFYFAEKSKASVLQEAISETQARQFADVPLAETEKEKQLLNDIALYEQKLAQVPDKETEKTYRTQLFNLHRQYESFILYLEKAYPRYYNLKYNHQPSSLPALQSSLDPTTALISYVSSDLHQRVYLFYVTKTAYQVYNVPLKKETYKMVHGLRNAITFHNDELYKTSAHFLYKQLFPFTISKQIKALAIVPDGILGTIPFEALLIKKPSENALYSYLLDRFEITYSYSATLYSQPSTTKGQEAKEALLCTPVTFQYPRLQLNTLPASAQEARAVSTLFLANKMKVTQLDSTKATEGTLKDLDLKKYRYIHLATHGEVNEELPELSRIFLSYSANTKEDGQLYSGELYNMQLNAELVTLSACETGLGKVVKGEGIIGLSRALLYAGADNLMVSLWKVSDNSTSTLMTTFYQELLKGKSKSAALQTAKLNLKTTLDKELNKTEEKQSVFYWSPFILIGK